MIAHLRRIIEQLANPFERANQLIDSSIGGQKWFIVESISKPNILWLWSELKKKISC